MELHVLDKRSQLRVGEGPPGTGRLSSFTLARRIPGAAAVGLYVIDSSCEGRGRGRVNGIPLCCTPGEGDYAAMADDASKYLG